MGLVGLWTTALDDLVFGGDPEEPSLMGLVALHELHFGNLGGFRCAGPNSNLGRPNWHEVPAALAECAGPRRPHGPGHRGTPVSHTPVGRQGRIGALTLNGAVANGIVLVPRGSQTLSAGSGPGPVGAPQKLPVATTPELAMFSRPQSPLPTILLPVIVAEWSSFTNRPLSFPYTPLPTTIAPPSCGSMPFSFAETTLPIARLPASTTIPTTF